MKSFHLVSLGCAKNLVDSELMLGGLFENGWQMVDDPDTANVIIINTCGFIQPAVEEAIEEILSMVEIKKSDSQKKLVVSGCMVQRYKDALVEELPEVDLFIGTEGAPVLAVILEDLLNSNTEKQLLLPDRMIMDASMPRSISTPFYRSWLKITEGCDNHCSYCMIPSIRGQLRSRGIEDLISEAKLLEQNGVKELCLIAQDLTAYGDDLDEQSNLEELLNGLLSETTIPWLRLLYLYPTGINDKLINLIKENSRIVPYLDIPFQHVSDHVLKMMKRRYGKKDIYKVVQKLRDAIPDIAIRTTFLLGFPGETEEDIKELEECIKELQFDHLGVFAYTNEEGSVSENFDDQLSEEVKQERVNHVLSLQSSISAVRMKQYIGKTVEVIVEGTSKETDLLLEGRTQYQAPEIDGCVYINEGEVSLGDIVEVEITEAQIYDLVGRVAEKG